MCHKASARFAEASTCGHRAVMAENGANKLQQGRIATEFTKLDTALYATLARIVTNSSATVG
jgi:hypothetical protein